jgi:hypothetical protein
MWRVAGLLVGLALLAPAQPANPAKLIEELEAENAAYLRLLADWGKLVVYGSDNAELRPPKPGENRVVFFGDDIFAKWADFFPDKPWN